MATLERESRMKEIPLTQGKVALVDDEDYDAVNQYKWCAYKSRGNWYAVRNVRTGGKQTTCIMHREIFGLTPGDGKQTDHINRNGLDNRRCNLRVCTNAENSRNQRMSTNNTSGFKGVHRHKVAGKWKAQIRHEGQRIHLGLFANPADAAKAYDTKAKELFGEFACINFPDSAH